MVSLPARAMGPCCALGRIVEGSMRHKALVRAILQVTGYRRAHVKEAGLIIPRTNGEFTPAFKKLVEDFLENLGCGKMFFPEKEPDYEGWKESFSYGERIKWVHWKIKKEPTEESGPPMSNDKDQIRQAVMLMFENLRDHDNTLDLEDSITLQSCLQDACCEICAGKKTADDEIAVCENCHVGRHQSCYELASMPNKPYYCRSCVASKKRPAEPTTRDTGKRVATSFIPDPKRFGPIEGSPAETRASRSRPNGVFQPLSGPKAEDTSSLRVKRRVSASTSHRRISAGTPQRHVSVGIAQRPANRPAPRRSTLLPGFGSSAVKVEPVSPAAIARSSNFNGPTPVAKAHSPETVVPSSNDKSPANDNDNHSVPQSHARFQTPTVSSVQSDVPYTPGDNRRRTTFAAVEPVQSNPTKPSTDIAEENNLRTSLPSKEVGHNPTSSAANVEKDNVDPQQVLSSTAPNILSQDQISRTKLRIRIGTKSRIYRSVELHRINPLNGLFSACVKRWEDRLNGRSTRIVAFLPKDLEGVTEITADSEVTEFLQLIKAEWDKGIKDDLTVIMVLLRDDEEF